MMFLMLSMACKKPYEDKSIGDPIYSADQLKSALNGKWIVSKAAQVDEKSITKEEIDITDFFLQEPGSQMPNIVFNTASSDFTSDTTGVAIQYFNSTGKYYFDDNEYPKNIILVSGTDTITLPIGSNIQINSGYLQFEKAGYCSGNKVMTTKLKLIKQ